MHAPVQARVQDQVQVRAPARARSIAATDRGGSSGALALATVVALVLAFPIRAAHAQNADAEALFTEAEALETAGKIPEACDAFEASNRLEARAGTLIRLGQCRETQGRLVSAWSAYKDALTRVKDPAKREVAEGRVAALAPLLSYLTVSVPDEARVDGLVVTRNGKPLDPALWNRAAPVDGGVYTIAGQAPGHEAWSTTVEVAERSDKVSVDVPRFKELRTLVEEPPPSGGPTAPAVDGPTTAPGMFTGRRKLALGVGVAGVVALGAGALLGLQAKGLEDDAYGWCPDPAMPCARAAEAQDATDRANTRALLANVGYGVGGAALIAGAVLWFTGAPSAEPGGRRAEPARVGVAPRVRGGFSGLDVTVRF